MLATYYTWTTAGGGDWVVPTNWSPASVPGDSDHATINADGGSVTVKSASYVALLRFQSGTLAILDGGTLTVVGDTFGAFIANATLDLGPDWILSVDSQSAFELGYVGGNRAGRVAVSTGDTIVASGSGVMEAALLNNGTFDVNWNASTEITGAVSGAGTFDVEGGLIEPSETIGPGILQFDSSVSSSNTIAFEPGIGDAPPVLRLLQPGLFGGVLSDSANGQFVVALPGQAITAASISGHTLIVDLAGGAVDRFRLSGVSTAAGVAVSGSDVTVGYRNINWTAAQSTNFADPRNWDDTTDGLDPALTGPGASDQAAITFSGTITGSGTVSNLLVSLGDPARATVVTIQGTLVALNEVSETYSFITIEDGGAIRTGELQLTGGGISADKNSNLAVITAATNGATLSLASIAGTPLSMSGTLSLNIGTLDFVGGGTISGALIDGNDAVLTGNGTLANMTVGGTVDISGVIDASTGVSFASPAGDFRINLTGILAFQTPTSLNNGTIDLVPNGDLSGDLTLGPNLFVADRVGVEYEIANLNGDIVNQGRILEETTGNALTISGGSFVNQGTLTVQDGAAADLESAVFNNAGTVVVNDATAAASGVFDNAGTLVLNTATLDLSGTVSSLGAIVANQGTIGLFGTLLNSGGTLLVSPDPGMPTFEFWQGLYSKTAAIIIGGTIVDTGGKLILSPPASNDEPGTLDGVAFDGLLDLSANEAAVTIGGGITLHGSAGTGAGQITVSGNGSRLYIDGNTTLDNATILLGATQWNTLVLPFVDNNPASLYSVDTSGTGAVLTLGAHLDLVETAYQAVLGTTQDLAGDGIINQGTIDAGGGGAHLTVNGASFINQGSMTIESGGTLDVASLTYSNSGTVNLAPSATLELGTSLSLQALGVVAGGGTLSIDLGTTLDLDGATLHLGTGERFSAIVLNGVIENGTIEVDSGGSVSFGTGVLLNAVLRGAPPVSDDPVAAIQLLTIDASNPNTSQDTLSTDFYRSMYALSNSFLAAMGVPDVQQYFDNAVQNADAPESAPPPAAIQNDINQLNNDINNGDPPSEEAPIISAIANGLPPPGGDVGGTINQDVQAFQNALTAGAAARPEGPSAIDNAMDIQGLAMALAGLYAGGILGPGLGFANDTIGFGIATWMLAHDLDSGASLDQIEKDMLNWAGAAASLGLDVISLNPEFGAGIGLVMFALAGLKALPQFVTRIFGDVHLTTFDGLYYNFQAEGEFVLTKSMLPADTFQVQIRLQPWNGSTSVSVMTQVAAQVGSDRVTFDVTRPGTVWVDGSAVTISATNPIVVLNGGVLVQTSATNYDIFYNTGETVQVTSEGSYLNLSVGLGPNNTAGSVVGLLGSDAGQANDFQLADGAVLAQPLTEAELYGAYANAWRVTQASSLFDYAPGQTTGTFTNLAFPSGGLTLADLPPALVQQAAQAVAAAGITDPNLAAGAELDYIATNDPSFLPGAAAAQQAEGSTTLANVTQETPSPPSIGVTAADTSLPEAASGPTSVGFDTYLTGTATTDTIVDYTVVAAGAGFLEAADFGGVLPSGQVTIVAGQTAAAFTITLPQAVLGTLASEGLQVLVSAPDAQPVFAPTAQVTVVNSQPEPGPAAIAQLVDLSDLGTFTQNGTTGTLDLGTVLQGQSIAPVQFGIDNTATAPADALSGSITATGNSAFVVTGGGTLAPIAAGQSDNGLTILADTATVGTQTLMLTFAPTDTNSSGYTAALPNQTLTVTLDVVGVPPRSIVWTGRQDTNFANAANWDDLTHSLDPAFSAPGYADSVAFTGSGGAISGTGTVTTLRFDGTGVWTTASGTVLTAVGQVLIADAAGDTTSLSIENGATLQAGNAFAQASPGFVVGEAAGGSGVAIVQGSQSSVENTGTFVVGDAGLGNLVVQSGGTVATTAGPAIIANTTAASGSSVNVTGPGSDWQIGGTLEVGNAGYGELSISQGATVTAGGLDAGVTGQGAIDLSGAGSALQLTGDGTVADAGSAEMSILNGATVSGTDLTVGSQGTSSGILTVSDAGSLLDLTGTLYIGTANGVGDLTVGPGATIIATSVQQQGQVVLEGGDLDPNVINVGADQSNGGYGGTGGDGDIIINDGTLLADAGTKSSEKVMTFQGTIVGQGLMQIDAGSTMELTGPVLSGSPSVDINNDGTPVPVSSTQTVNFEAGTGALQLNDIGGFAGTIGAYYAGDLFVITGGVLSGLGVSNGTTLTVGDGGGADSLVFAAPVSAGRFSIVNGNTIAVVQCFAAGTRIETDHGPVAVEHLASGDRVAVVDGRQEPIVWIGRRTVNCAAHPRPEQMWPVRVRAGAFGPQRPSRDLYLSPDHAVFVTHVLVPVKYLVNGASIAQVPRATVTYFHIELPAHDIILAEGLPVESYLDTGDRANFANGGAIAALFPNFTAAQWEMRGCAPLVVTGPELDAARAEVRAAA